MKYIKPFDGIRGIAVLLVIIWHWFQNQKINAIPNGPLGVTLFFVLSGFLITGILLDGKSETDAKPADRKNYIKRFFIRRALRIFPIYYLIVIPFFLYALVSHLSTYKYFYYLTYTSNIYFYRVASWDNYLAHIWSLAVEEQFYLVWPLIVILVNRRYLLTTILMFIGIGLAGQFFYEGEKFGEVLTFTCFDSLGMGALLAWIRSDRPAILNKLTKISAVVAILVCVLLYIELFELSKFIIPLRMQLTVIAFFVTTYLVRNSYNMSRLPTFLDIILNNKYLVAFGKISYGVYLYHLLIPYATLRVLGPFYKYFPLFLKEHFNFLFVPLNFVALVVVSVLSWQIIEKPLLGLKKHFAVNKGAKTPVTHSD